MKSLALLIAAAVVLLPASAEAKKKHHHQKADRPHVVIHKQPTGPAYPRPPLTVVSVPVVAIPPLAVFYDLSRRVNCLQPVPDPLGLGGPGFDRPVTPAEGNVMVPCHQRLYYGGGARPK